jgi:hypothetical protein
VYLMIFSIIAFDILVLTEGIRLMIGKILKHYEITSQLGKGGMGGCLWRFAPIEVTG